MMKTKIGKARVFVTAKFKSEGSVLAETVKAMGVGFETRLELESEEPPERVAQWYAMPRTGATSCRPSSTQCQLSARSP